MPFVMGAKEWRELPIEVPRTKDAVSPRILQASTK